MTSKREDMILSCLCNQDAVQREDIEHFLLQMGDGRFKIPDLYRVGFRLGRRGGVKPLP